MTYRLRVERVVAQRLRTDQAERVEDVRARVVAQRANVAGGDDGIWTDLRFEVGGDLMIQ